MIKRLVISTFPPFQRLDIQELEAAASRAHIPVVLQGIYGPISMAKRADAGPAQAGDVWIACLPGRGHLKPRMIPSRNDLEPLEAVGARFIIEEDETARKALLAELSGCGPS